MQREGELIFPMFEFPVWLSNTEWSTLEMETPGNTERTEQTVFKWLFYLYERVTTMVKEEAIHLGKECGHEEEKI